MLTTKRPRLAVTGHRLAKLSGKKTDLQAFAEDQLIRVPFGTPIISGMALGWDQAIAFAAVSLGYPLIAAIPFANQPKLWTGQQTAAWEYLKSKASEWYVISASLQYTPGCYQDRNKWMIDRAESVLALWNGSPGGTANCIEYAVQCNKPITNVWKEWKQCR